MRRPWGGQIGWPYFGHLDAGYAFFPITLNEFGGHGTSGLEWLRVIAHEGDGAMLGKNYDLGERFYHEHQTFVSMKSRSWIVQTVGVAIANATYAAARRIARFAAPLARNVFPTLDIYVPYPLAVSVFHMPRSLLVRTPYHLCYNTTHTTPPIPSWLPCCCLLLYHSKCY